MGKGNLTRGASVMVAMVTLAKVLGLIYIIPLTRIIHEEGLGIYGQAYNFYIILNTLSTSGFPTAMAKLISERLALKRYGDVEQMYRLTIRIVFVLGVILFVVMWVGAPLYSHLVALKEPAEGAEAMTMSIRALSFALLVVPVMSALRGYLQGFQEMEPSAYSQALEQFVRVIAIVVGAYVVVKQGGSIAAGAAAATFGAVVGALAGVLLLMAAVVPLRRSFLRQTRSSRTSESAKRTVHAMFQIGMPVSLGNLVIPFSGLVDSLTVQNMLMFSGYSFATATAAYGILSRQAMQLIQLPLAFAGALGVAILPALAESKALGDKRAIHTRITGTIRSMMFMTLPVAASLLVLAAPIDEIWAGNHKGAVIISSVCFMSIFSSLELISTFMLQGLGKMYRPVRNMMIGVGVKLVFNLILIPPFHILGAAIATTIGYIVSSTLNVLAVKKYGQVRFSVWRLTAPSTFATIFLCVTLAVGSWAGFHLGNVLTHAAFAVASIQIVVSIGLGGIVYVWLSIVFGAVSGPELARVPLVGRPLSRFAPSKAR
ncbi:polysaccharide biosynthesis protein [Alicyclobacillus curvatus]|nr:polysaccharide biosynthesis protein [Alicyclobacillus curvatus]